MCARLVGDDIDRSPRLTSSGSTAALPTSAIDTASPTAAAATRPGLSNESVRRSHSVSPAAVGALGIDLDAQRHASFIVTASGCAPPMPPRPAVSTTGRAATECWRPSSANVS
jgi:hypothetical protein